MSEEINVSTDTAIVADVTPEISADVTPEIQETETEIKETTETKAPDDNTEESFLGTYKSKDEALKGLSEKDRYIRQLETEKADLAKAKEQQQFTEQKQQVETESYQVRAERYQKYQAFKEINTNLRIEALNTYNETGDHNQLLARLEQLDDQLDDAKKDAELKLTAKETELQKKQRELSQQTTANAFSEFEAKEAVKLSKPENKALLEAFKAKNFKPEELNDAFELGEIYLNAYLKGEASKKAISESINADKKAMSSTNPKGGAGGTKGKIETLDDIINNY